MRIAMAATPKRAQATKMDRPAGVCGEKSPGQSAERHLSLKKHLIIPTIAYCRESNKACNHHILKKGLIAKRQNDGPYKNIPTFQSPMFLSS